MCSNAVNTTISVSNVFIVVARVEAQSSLIQVLRGADNEFLTQSLADTENIFYSGCFPIATPSTTSAYPYVMPISIDMKAKRKMTTNDSIVMFTYTSSVVGTSDQDCIVSGVSTVIAI